jgi:hypothetical protein
MGAEVGVTFLPAGADRGQACYGAPAGDVKNNGQVP